MSDSRLNFSEHFEHLNFEYNQELRNMVFFAARLFNASVAFITLEDNGTEIIKIQHGLGSNSVKNKIPFCFHNFHDNKLRIIEDTEQHHDLMPNPGVCDCYDIRFYMAAPLVTHQKRRIGTLCVAGDVPRKVTPQEKLILKILARHVVSIMEFKLSLVQLDQSFKDLRQERENRLNNELKLRSLFESLTDAYFLLDKKGEIISYNKAAYEIIKQIYNVELHQGFVLRNILPQNFRDAFAFNMHNALSGKRKQMERVSDYGVKGKVWWDCTFDPVRDNEGNIMGVSYVARNITERKQSEEKILEQNRLLTRIAEIQSHDYRGPVASIIGLMNLIEKDDYVASKEYLQMLQKAVNQLDQKIHEVVGIVVG